MRRTSPIVCNSFSIPYILKIKAKLTTKSKSCLIYHLHVGTSNHILFKCQPLHDKIPWEWRNFHWEKNERIKEHTKEEPSQKEGKLMKGSYEITSLI